MRRLYLLAILIAATFSNVNAQKICCPKFWLSATQEPCDTIPKNSQSPVQYGYSQCELKACNNSAQKYFVYPNNTGLTYTWQVLGGAPVTLTGNAMDIVWGSGSSGKITVYISNADGSCRDTIRKEVCLVRGPKANFNFMPVGPVCNNTAIQFNNTSVGSVAYYWNFGDGNTAVTENPNHTYTAPGTYNVVLTVTSFAPVGGAIQDRPSCGCKDTIMKTIVVKKEEGISIIAGCKKMLCRGDTSSYCAGGNCSSYNWSVTGGNIIGSKNDECVNVVWDGSYPSSVTLNGNCGGSCGNTATINVPVLYPAIPITGKNIVCPSSVSGYSLPAMPGTFYTWTIAGGGTISGPNENTSTINVQWGAALGSYIITCSYQNPTTHCSGNDTILVKIAPKYKIVGSEKFCVGSNFNFTANGAGAWNITPAIGYTPSGFPAGSSIAGTWNIRGNYIVNANASIAANFCEAIAVHNVMVLDTPKLNPIIGNPGICPGSAQVYSISSNMNEPSFIWSIPSPVGGNIIATMGSNNDSVVVQWNAAGPYSLSVVQNVNGCSSSPKTFSPSIYTAPVFTGSLNTCMDNEITYTSVNAAPPGGYVWTLSNANGSIISGQGTNSIKVMWHGTSSMLASSCVLTLTTCGGTFSQTINIQAPPPLNISSPNNLCNIGGQILTSSLTGTFQWFLNGTAMAPGFNTQSISVLAGGNYSLIVTSAGGCKSKAYFTVAAPYFPQASISTPDKIWWKCTENINTTFTALPNGAGYCYEWHHAGSIVGSNTPTYTATTPGNTWCVVSLCNSGCRSNSDTVMIVKESCDPAGPDCNPNYSYNLTHSSCNPFNFNLTVNPPAASNTAHWYFGDGKWDSEGWGLNMTHKYDHIGNYNVCVILGSAPYCRKDTCFNINVPLTANFKTSINCKTVTITNLSETITPLSTTYNWNFPGGNITSSILQNPPNIIYNSNGTFPITLTVSNGICTEIFVDSVKINMPSAASTIPSPICALTNAPFIATVNGTGFTYHWVFGDGFTSNLQNAGHTYATAGTYNVILTVTDEKGCTAKDTTVIQVLPALVVSIGADQSFCAGGSATFSASPAGFSSYQWYKDGVAITGATSPALTVNAMGMYRVEVSNGDGCKSISNVANAFFKSSPIAKINKMKVQCKSGTSTSFNISNHTAQAGCIYRWTCISANCAGATFTSNNSYAAWNTQATVNGLGDFQFVLEVTNTAGCKSFDTLCVTVVNGLTVSITNPSGTLCEGQLHTFMANAIPPLTLPDQYFYQWSTGTIGNTTSIGFAGTASVTATNSNGCIAMAFTAPIKKRADISLFPVGCDTLCLTDTIHFPLPIGGGLSASSYSIQWYDSGTPVGTNSILLPLALIGPGDHHFYCIVTLSGSCPVTTGTFDLFVKDCTLLPPCDNCPAMFDNATFSAGILSGNIMQGSFTFTSTKPLKEVRINVADLKYHWSDPACKNCKVTIEDRACIYPANASQTLGSLVWDNFTGAVIPPATSVTDCPKLLIFKPGAILPPGSYSIPLQVSFSAPPKNNCKLIVDKFCMHLTITDEECKVCEKNVCAPKPEPPTKDSCDCSAGGNWTNLFIVPAQVGVPKPKTLIFCNSSITGYSANTPYLLSGMYNCRPPCVSVKNEVVIRNQTGDIIYTHIGATLYENILFPAKGIYTVNLTAYCGGKKCECKFQIVIDKETVISEPPVDTEPPISTNNPRPPNTGDIEKVLTDILPPDFSGGILIAKKDSILYEKYKGNKVNAHTAFDLASVAKTFTAMAVLKMAEEKRINIADDVTKYLSGFPISGITVKMLLSHTSGLEDYVKFMQAAEVDKTDILSNNDLLQYVIKNKEKVQAGKPGSKFNYSNTNFAMLALIIEKISRQTYGQYLSDKFFRPLNMEDTYVYGPATVKTATPSYYKNGKAYGVKFLDFIYGDKNVYSTVKDMMKWDKALRDGKMFSKESMAMAYTPGSTLIADQSNYGLGWRLLLVPNGKKIIYHNGWWHGNRSVFIRLLEEDAVIIILSNSSFTTISNSRKLADLFGAYKQTGKNIINF